MLNVRQCRYYALAILFSLLAARLYLRWRPGVRWALQCALVALALLATSYLAFAALAACVAADWLLFRRAEVRPTPRAWLALLAPIVVVGGTIVAIWNPLGKHVVIGGHHSFLADRVTLLWWNLRDLNRNELGSAGMLMLAAVVAVVRHDRLLQRGLVALANLHRVITLTSPQPLGITWDADIRYLGPVIPLCAMIAVRVIVLGTETVRWAAWPLAVVVFFTNGSNGGALTAPATQSTFVEFLHELADPPGDPYRVAAAWLDANVHAGQSVAVAPDYMAFPLMFHVPQAVYGWLLAWPPAPQFAGLEPILFRGRQDPDYIVAFGPSIADLARHGPEWAGLVGPYREVATLDFPWRDRFRPELMWRTFWRETATSYVDRIHVLQRTAAP